MDARRWVVWYLIAGGVLLLMTLVGSLVQRLPLTTAMLYLGLGVLLGPAGGGMLEVDLQHHAALIEHITEVAVLISPFTAGLKLRLPFSDPQWRLALRLACTSMILTIGGLTWVGIYG